MLIERKVGRMMLETHLKRVIHRLLMINYTKIRKHVPLRKTTRSIMGTREQSRDDGKLQGQKEETRKGSSWQVFIRHPPPQACSPSSIINLFHVQNHFIIVKTISFPASISYLCFLMFLTSPAPSTSSELRLP